MDYNADQHSIECPKCGHGMDEISYGGDLLIDRCTHCQGIWFDHGEIDVLKGKWMGEALDTGKPSEGKKWDEIDDIPCPRCGQQMEKGSDPDQPHIRYEVCHDHGMFMDAGEFTDLKNETLGDWFKRFIKRPRG
jgi:Zn-finger nucleic acid-binding protein